jgi:hypothetical protein
MVHQNLRTLLLELLLRVAALEQIKLFLLCVLTDQVGDAKPPLVMQRLGKEWLKFSPPLYIFVAVVRFSVQRSSKFTSAFEHLHMYVFMEMMLDNLNCHVALSRLELFLNVLLSQHFLKSWSKQNANKNILEILITSRNF